MELESGIVKIKRCNKMKNIKITCDSCEKDITETESMPTFRLVLSSEKLPSSSNSTYAVLVSPPIGHTHYFCNLICLKRWLDARQLSQ